MEANRNPTSVDGILAGGGYIHGDLMDDDTWYSMLTCALMVEPFPNGLSGRDSPHHVSNMERIVSNMDRFIHADELAPLGSNMVDHQGRIGGVPPMGRCNDCNCIGVAGDPCICELPLPLVDQATGEDLDPYAIPFMPRPEYTRSVYILNLPVELPDLYRAYKKDPLHRSMPFSEFIAYRELTMFQNTEEEDVDSANDAHIAASTAHFDAIRAQVHLDAIRANTVPDVPVASDIPHVADASWGFSQVSDATVSSNIATDDTIDDIIVSAADLAVSDADEEEKVDFIDVKNDVKNNSSTTDYLPTFF